MLRKGVGAGDPPSPHPVREGVRVHHCEAVPYRGVELRALRPLQIARGFSGVEAPPRGVGRVAGRPLLSSPSPRRAPKAMRATLLLTLLAISVLSIFWRREHKPVVRKHFTLRHVAACLRAELRAERRGLDHGV